MTSSSLSVFSSFSSMRGDDEPSVSPCVSFAAPPDHMEISEKLAEPSGTTVGAVFVASKDAGGGGSVIAGLTPERISGLRVSSGGGGLGGTAGACREGNGTKRSVGDSGATRSGHLFCWEASAAGGASALSLAGVERATEGDGDGGAEGFDEPILPSTGEGSVRRTSGSGSSEAGTAR
jgi:hypothetical protein